MANVSFYIPYFTSTPFAPDFYTSPAPIGTLNITGSKDFWNTFTPGNYVDLVNSMYVQGGHNVPGYNYYISIKNANGSIVYQQSLEYDDGWYYVTNNNGVITKSAEFFPDGGNLPDSFVIPAFSVTINTTGIYTIEYAIAQAVGTGYIALTYNRLPLKKWTITDVVNRCFDLIEPLTYGQKPRFRLQGQNYDNTTGNPTTVVSGSQADKYSSILAPEYAFTRQTLKEMLTDVCGYIHAVPRVTGKLTDNYGDEYWNVIFDEYGSTQVSNISKKAYVGKGSKTNVNEYCTTLDSSAENLISQLDYAQGVVIEPFNEGGRSLRTDQTTVRLGEDNTSFIKTDYPIYSIGQKRQVICRYIPTVGYGAWDITPYVFEKADYDGTLDSFSSVYPFSRSCALYYQQGSPNIYGLFFKVDNALTPALSNYAIRNILEAVTGQTINLSYQQYMELAFSVSYLPIFGTRVQTNKQFIVKSVPRSLAYNQDANVIETRYYGENLKGVIARLGNVEKTYTYHIPFLSEVPKVGTLFDKNYYISVVSVEVLPLYIKCTIGLSKDFNRRSQYIGISSNKRMWEVSEKQSIDRQNVYKEYLKISQTDNVSSANIAWQGGIVENLFNTVNGYSVNAVSLSTYDKKENIINNGYNIVLPVISTALGNSLLFNFKLEDNYSAGQKVEYLSLSSNTDINGYWAQYVPYCDYYGRFYYCDKQFYINNPTMETDSGTTNPQASSVSGDVKIYIQKQKYRKDNREVPNDGYELCAVTDDESVVIGSALFKNCMLVNTSPITVFQVYAFTTRLNVINSKVDLTNGTYVGTVNVNTTDNTVTLPNIENNNYVSWAIITQAQSITIDVEDEDGNATTQTITLGGELMFGQNGDYPHGQTFNFTIKTIRDIYEL